MSPRKRILFLTNSEYGESNVCLAVCQECLLHQEYDVHVGSFPSLKPRLDRINQAVATEWDARGLASPIPQATFHLLYGSSLTELTLRNNIDLPHGPGIFGAVRGFRTANSLIFGMPSADYMLSYNSCLRVINEVQPSLLVVDPIFHTAVDACRTVGIRTIVLWPTPFKDVVITVQPYGGMLWKFPLTGSGYSFPLPWHLIPANVYLFVRFAATFLLGSELRSLLACRKQIGIQHSFPLVEPYRKEDFHLSPAIPELDYPLYLPHNVFGCGPILFPSQPLSSNSELVAFLKQPTILINLGSHHKPSTQMALGIAQGLRLVLEREKVQVLWKLKFDRDELEEIREILRDTESRVKITPWIEPELISVLEYGNIMIFVHHGGANSFFEACKTGVPQVVLPQWLDTYDCAARVEWLGIGQYGNRTAAPDVNAQEFSESLLKVLVDERFVERSMMIKELCVKSEGREVAYAKIAELIRSEEAS